MIFVCCLLTVLIELLFLGLWGYRSAYAVTVIACANTASNLTLNLGIAACFPGSPGRMLLPMELLVVLAEYLVYAVAFGRSRRLFLLTAAANAVSFFTGVLLFGI